MRYFAPVPMILLAASALAQDTGALQVPTAIEETSLQIAKPSGVPLDPLSIEQPSAEAVDTCESNLANSNGTNCESVALPPNPAVTSRTSHPVTITRDGVFLRLEPQNDAVFDPDDIARRLQKAAKTPPPEDFGVNAVASETITASIVIDEPVPPPTPHPDVHLGAYEFKFE